jgi:hypothetical protein
VTYVLTVNMGKHVVFLHSLSDHVTVRLTVRGSVHGSMRG